MRQVDAVIMAGGIPGPDEPLFALTQGKPKALLPMAGRSMLEWVVAALEGAATIRRIAVGGLDSTEVALSTRKPLVFAPNQGSMMGNAQAGLVRLGQEGALSPWVLLVSVDIPALTPEMVDWSVTTSLQTDHDGYYSLIARDKMEARFPGSRRSYFHFKDGVFTGGDMNLLATKLVAESHPLAPALIEARKDIFKQAALIGLDVLVLFALRRLTVDEAARRISQRLKIRGRALICPYPEVGMDVDKPWQYELMKRDLETRVAWGRA
jgi:GTP:adenosylcobinamide-phosphate guanylyltransferase